MLQLHIQNSLTYPHLHDTLIHPLQERLQSSSHFSSAGRTCVNHDDVSEATTVSYMFAPGLRMISFKPDLSLYILVCFEVIVSVPYLKQSKAILRRHTKFKGLL